MVACVETLYEEDRINTTAMQARQSSQPTHHHLGNQTEQCIPISHIEVKHNETTKDVNVPSMCLS